MDAYTLHLFTLDPLTVAAEGFHTKAHRDMVAEWELQKSIERLRPRVMRTHEENMSGIREEWQRRDKAEADKARAARIKSRRTQAMSRAMPKAKSREMPEATFTDEQIQTAVRAQEKRMN
jgi:beta-phosphoglucomutase-like phosphatase (HAD superfamily)